ncbi:hypothetical protein FRC07_002719, partial [Ceratobasidium sp. 392]
FKSLDYTIAPTNINWPVNSSEYPNIWLVSRSIFDEPIVNEDDLRINSAPQLIPAIQASPGLHTTTSVSLTMRRFIVSSGIQDAITGSTPRFLEVNFYPSALQELTGIWKLFYVLETVSALPLNSTSGCLAPGQNSSIVSCGTINVLRSERSPTLTQTQLRSDKQSSSYCPVIEDYRESSTFDVLGSIGGLLALLQGIHIFLFGRPLFWGMFGAKLLTPFGVVGRFANKGFRKRLRERYYAADSDTSQAHRDEAGAIRMNQFLLDYVLDMGPAAIVTPARSEGPAVSASPDVEASNILETKGQSESAGGEYM